MDVDAKEQVLLAAPKPIAHVLETDGRPVNPAGKKKAGEIVSRMMGNETTIPLTLKELAAVLPVVVDEMVQVLKDCGHNTVPPMMHQVNLDWDEAEHKLAGMKLVSTPLGYVSMKIAGRKVWVLVDSCSMVNLLPSRLVDEMGLVWKKCTMGLHTLNGGACCVDGVLEEEEVEVARFCKPLSFLLLTCGEAVLGRPFMFGFQAQMIFEPEAGTEAFTAEDLLGGQFKTTI